MYTVIRRVLIKPVQVCAVYSVFAFVARCGQDAHFHGSTLDAALDYIRKPPRKSAEVILPVVIRSWLSPPLGEIINALGAIEHVQDHR